MRVALGRLRCTSEVFSRQPGLSRLEGFSNFSEAEKSLNHTPNSTKPDGSSGVSSCYDITAGASAPHAPSLSSLASDAVTTCEWWRNVRLHRTSLILDQQDTNRTRHRDCHMICTYNARTVSSNAYLHALLKAAGSINFRVIALQETRAWKNGAQHRRGGTLVIP